MALTVIKGQGLLYPFDFWANNPSAFAQALDAADEQLAFIGHIYIDGRPTAAKTFSATGGGSISLRTGTVTFANGATSVLVGIQDVITSAGPAVRPDETFDVQSAALVGSGSPPFVTNTWTTISMTGGSGSKSITHGDFIAVVVNMTARGGVDSLAINANGGIPNSLVGRPTTTAKIGGAWATHGGHPNVLITFDDGTIATLDGSLPYSVGAQESFSAATNPDERGLLFQVPWEVKIDGFWAAVNGTAAGSDFTMKLYGDPTGTPVELYTQDFLGEQFLTNANRPFFFLVPTQITLSKDTNYGLVGIATGASTITMFAATLGNEAHRALYTGGTTLAKITRNDGTGAFAAESPAITRPLMGISISQFHDGAGAGGGGGGSVFGSKGGVIA